MESAKRRLGQFPKHFLQCTAEATNYGKCVAVKDNIKKDDCIKEFLVLKECFQKAAKKK